MLLADGVTRGDINFHQGIIIVARSSCVSFVKVWSRLDHLSVFDNFTGADYATLR